MTDAIISSGIRHSLAQWFSRVGFSISAASGAGVSRFASSSSVQSRSYNEAASHTDLPTLLAELACDVASCASLKEELPGLMVPASQWLKNQPQTRHLKLTGLLWPAAEGDALQAIALLQRADSRWLSDLALLIPDTHSDAPLKWSDEEVEFLLVPLPVSTTRAWLVLSWPADQTELNATDNQSIRDGISPVLRPLLRPLTRGLCGYHRHQQSQQKTLQEERQLHAAELHDTVAQVLGYVKLRSAQLADHCREGQCDQLGPDLEELSQQCQFAYRQTRELISGSRLIAPGDSLVQGIEQAIHEFEQRSPIIFEFDNRCGAITLPPTQQHQALFIVREALCNLVRHSHASHGRVRLLRDDQEDTLTLIVEDNGRGLTSGHSSKSSDRGSFGLQIMRDRARRIGARIEVGSRAPQGTRIELILPTGGQIQ